MEELEEEINRLAALIDAPKHLLPTFGYSNDFARPHVELKSRGKKFHLVIVERGQERERWKTADKKEFLFWIFESVTASMADKLELQNRIEGEDSRIQSFRIREELIGVIDPDYRERLEVKHRKLLGR